MAVLTVTKLASGSSKVLLPAEAHSFPLGTSLPPRDKHAISVSLPTWSDITRYMKYDKDIHDNLESDYPRFYQHASVATLNAAVLTRVKADQGYQCMIFPSVDGMRRCVEYFDTKLSCCSTITAPVELHQVHFELARPDDVVPDSIQWTTFYAVLFPVAVLRDAAVEFWGWMGDGISSRQADFLHDRFGLMRSTAMSPSSLQLNTDADLAARKIAMPSPWSRSDRVVKTEIKTLISQWMSSERSSASLKDIFLFPKGMVAIATVARLLVPHDKRASEAVIYGWPYGSTPKALQCSGYERFTFYGQGSSEELDQLEARLESGEKIACLVCEVPSNPLCATPDLHRIRHLADKYDFTLICDETIGTFINVDVLSFVDLTITSLTKLFSGGCNVMAGCVSLNSQSQRYKQLQALLQSAWEDVVFPMDAQVLLRNCIDFPERVRIANHNAEAVVRLFSSQSKKVVARVNYPTTVPSAGLYETYKRPNGGYGSLISIIFEEPSTAIRFYDAVDLAKGPSFGANFTLVLPYSQLAHAFELDWAESQGMPKHIIRISVGLEDEDVLVRKFSAALKLL